MVNNVAYIMGLSARTDDRTGLPLGEGYVSLATSAGHRLVFRDPASANIYQQDVANAAQLGSNEGSFNDETSLTSA